MRLLHSETLEMREFLGSDIPFYAILSHTWAEEEITLQDMQQKSIASNKAGYSKVTSCCNQAKQDGLDWVWIDTCCIDKTSSAELSEAINSMFEWYQDSVVCYVFLKDVPPIGISFPEKEFQQARWFKRGWCLQEPIAPAKIEFYALDWKKIGTKWSLYSQIEKVTGIPLEVLLKTSNLANYPTAQKLAWASKRETSRREDEAYCLLGIFDISMPLLYGEGHRAFFRLQEEIMRKTEDLSFLLWADATLNWLEARNTGVLALSPRHFSMEGSSTSTRERHDTRSIKLFYPTRHNNLNATQWKPPQVTSRGLYIQAFVQKSSSAQRSSPWLLWAGCTYGSNYACIKIVGNESRGVVQYSRSESYHITLVDAKTFDSFELYQLYLSVDSHPGQSKLAVSSLPLGRGTHLSIKCGRALCFVDASPHMYLPGNSHRAQRTRFYHKRVSTKEPISLRFKAGDPLSRANSENFNVILGPLEGPFIWCEIMVDSTTNKSSSHNASTKSKSENDRDVVLVTQNEIEHDIGYTDRAIGQLSNGCIVYVTINENRSPDTRWRCMATQGTPVSLYVSLLPATGDSNPKVCGANSRLRHKRNVK